MRRLHTYFETWLLLGLALAYGLWLAGQDPAPTGPLRVVSLHPPTLSAESSGEGLYRTDYYGIDHLDRSDSAATMQLIGRHLQSVLDTIQPARYTLYQAQYYQTSQLLNDSALSAQDEPHWRADETQGYVCWVSYHQGQLASIRWWPTGAADRYVVLDKQTQHLRQAGVRYYALSPAIERAFAPGPRGPSRGR